MAVSSTSFSFGNPGGPGRPRRETEKKYLRAAAGRVPLKKWRQIVDKAVELALGGDAPARSWLSKILCGDDPLALIELVEQMYAVLDHAKTLPNHQGSANGTGRSGGAAAHG